MCFKALIREEDVNTERNAVLNEMRDTSDIDDRVASKYYEHMFNETKLPRRFPIGKEAVICAATADTLRHFYDTHYHPSNMHLFVVGDIDPEEILTLIQHVYGEEPGIPRAGALIPSPAHATPASQVLHAWPLRGQMLKHIFYEKPAPGYAEVRHSQLTSFFMSMTMKEELESNAKYRHLYEELVDSLVGMALDSRAQELRSQLGDPPFYSLDWNYLNSPREGCVLDSLTVHGEARNWQSAVRSAVDLVSSIVKYGLVQTELDRLVATLMRQFELDAEQQETQESGDVLSRLQECAEAGDAFMTASQRLDIFRQLLPAISLEIVNHRARQLYGFACDGGKGSDLRNIFVCGPTNSAEGENFDSLQPDKLQAILKQAAEEADEYEDTVVVPEYLCGEKEMDSREKECAPKFVALEGFEGHAGVEMSKDSTRAVSTGRIFRTSSSYKMTI